MSSDQNQVKKDSKWKISTQVKDHFLETELTAKIATDPSPSPNQNQVIEALMHNRI